MRVLIPYTHVFLPAGPLPSQIRVLYKSVLQKRLASLFYKCLASLAQVGLQVYLTQAHARQSSTSFTSVLHASLTKVPANLPYKSLKQECLARVFVLHARVLGKSVLQRCFEKCSRSTLQKPNECFAKDLQARNT